MKKILSILLIFMLFFNAGGYYFVYVQLLNTFKLTAQDKLKEQITLEKLEIITVDPLTSGTQEKPERTGEDEIKYRGKMYDIFQENTVNGITYFYCVNDAYEDMIMKAFAEYLNEDTDEDSNTAVISLIKMLITHAVIPPAYTYNYNTASSGVFNDYVSRINKSCSEIPSPPPKQA